MNILSILRSNMDVSSRRVSFAAAVNAKTGNSGKQVLPVNEIMSGLATPSAALLRSLATVPLILGSGSASRRQILNELGLSFSVEKPDIDERAIRRERPADLVLALGLAKAAALCEGERGAALRAKGALVLTGDQVVVCNGAILEKPEDEAEARRFIASYGEHPPSTVGSCVVTDAATGRQWHTVDEASVIFDPIPDATVAALLKEGEVFYCAGGLMVEHPLVQPHVRRMEGTMDSVMGLSKASVVRLLAEAVAAR